MSWETAMTYARRRAYWTGRRYYVRGYRTRDGRWLYGPYLVPRPDNGRTWQA